MDSDVLDSFSDMENADEVRNQLRNNQGLSEIESDHQQDSLPREEFQSDEPSSHSDSVVDDHETLS